MDEAQIHALPTGERAERKRGAIVDAARERFLREGYDASVDAIAADAGVSKATVYNHFGSKEALFMAIVGEELDKALSSTLTEAEAQLRDTGDVREALIRTARSWVAGVTQPDVLALRNLVTAEIRRFPELGKAWEERGPRRFFSLLTSLFERLQERGELRIKDAEVATVQLFALTLYPHFVFASYGSVVPPELSERLVESGIDMFLSHYRSSSRGGDA